MDGSTKMWGSVAGVSVAAAVVVGAVLGAAGGGSKAPAQQPVGNQRPIASTSSARPVAPVAVKVSPSTSKAAAPVARRKPNRAAVVNQEPPVNVPTPTDPPSTTPDRPDSTLIDEGPGTTDESGIRRAPAPTVSHPAPPPVQVVVPAPSPS